MEQTVPLLILTSAFPYGKGEQFLAEEMEYWPTSARCIVVPVSRPGVRRAVRSDVEVDDTVAAYRTRFRLALGLVVATVHPLFLAEIRDLVRLRRLSLAHLVKSYRAVAQTLVLARALQVVTTRHGGSRIYTYWNGIPAYAAALLKRRGGVEVVVSRAHGTDLHEAPSTTWMPLKRQMVRDFDHVWTVSEEGRRAYVQTYAPSASPASVSVARLGVDIPERAGQRDADEVFRVLSIASCRPVKQLPLLVEALAAFAQAHPERQVSWVHLGGGEGLSGLRAFAESRLGGATQLSHELRGHVDHAQVHRVLDTEQFDLIVNVSRSEGVPVSLMEAMARGVPALAPRIGGIPELVTPGSGWLVPAPCSPSSVMAGLSEAWGRRHVSDHRELARATVAQRYSRRENYEEFARLLMSAISR